MMLSIRYLLLTKAGLLLIGYLAISTIRVSAITGFIVCFFAAGAVVYPLAFRTEKKTIANRYVGGTKHRFILYLLRYLWNNKNYLVNTAALWTFGCIFSMSMSKMDFPNIYTLGLAIMCLNTPLGILLSGDKALYRQVLSLPGQTKGILFPYALFVTVVNAIACTLYLVVWYLATERITLIMMVLAALFSVMSATLTVALEMKYPLLNWKVENDLWHHPRKYIVPGIMVLLATVLIFLV